MAKLIGECAKALKGEAAAVVSAAYKQVEDEEDEHLYHSKGWCRELWLKSLGLNAVLPPPEEKRDVKTAVDAAKARQQRTAQYRIVKVTLIHNPNAGADSAACPAWR